MFVSDILLSASYSETNDDFIDVEMQCDMLFILSVLCEKDMHKKVSIRHVCSEVGSKFAVCQHTTKPNVCTLLGRVKMAHILKHYAQ